MIASIKNIFFQNSEERVNKIITGSLKWTFLLIAFPGILTRVIQACMPLLDGLIIYNYDSPISGAAISFVAAFHNIFIVSSKGLSSAGGAIVGRINGTGDFERSKKVAGQVISITIIMGFVLMPVLYVVGLIVAGYSGNEELASKIITYNSILIFSIPFIVIQDTYNSIKSVFGHPEMALLRTLIFIPIKLLNSVIFIMVLDLGIVGAGIASGLTYFIVSIFIFKDLFFKKGTERITPSDLKLEKKVTNNILNKAWPAMLQNSTKSISFFLVRLQLTKFGAVALSGNDIAGNINQIFVSFIACYESAIISFVSINLGAKKPRRARDASRFALRLSIVVALFFTVTSFYISPYIMRLYTSDPAILDVAMTANKYYNLGLLGFAVMFNEMPVFIAIGKTKISLLIQFTRIWFIRLGVLYLLNLIFPALGVISIFLSLTIANTMGGVLSHLFYRRIKWSRLAKARY